MKRVAILLADGFEEIEALATADIIRRAGISLDLVSMNNCIDVVSGRDITVKADKIFIDMDDYQMLILPGGKAAWTNRDDERVISLIKKYNDENKIIASICAGPMALGRAGILDGKKVTSFPDDEIKSFLGDVDYLEDEVVTDSNITTSRGPATTFAFAYRLVELLGEDQEKLKDDMLYNMIK